MKTATTPSYRVLLADDQSDIRDSLRLLLKGEGYETQGVASPAEALNALEAREFDAVLMDLNYARDTTSGQEGLDLLTRIQVIDSTVPVVVMTAWSSIELAVEAMRRGARDFIASPGKITACFPSFERKSTCVRLCVRPLASRPKTASCARNRAPPFWPILPRWLPSLNSLGKLAPPTPMF